MLSVAYKNVIGARRASWRIISSIEQKEEAKKNEAQVSKVQAYRKKVEGELSDICHDILNILDEHLIPKSGSGESKVFFYKMYVDKLLYKAINANTLVLQEGRLFPLFGRIFFGR